MSAPERIWADDDGIWHTFDYSEIRPSIEFVRAASRVREGGNVE